MHIAQLIFTHTITLLALISLWRPHLTEELDGLMAHPRRRMQVLIIPVIRVIRVIMIIRVIRDITSTQGW